MILSAGCSTPSWECRDGSLFRSAEQHSQPLRLFPSHRLGSQSALAQETQIRTLCSQTGNASWGSWKLKVAELPHSSLSLPSALSSSMRAERLLCHKERKQQCFHLLLSLPTRVFPKGCPKTSGQTILTSLKENQKTSMWGCGDLGLYLRG